MPQLPNNHTPDNPQQYARYSGLAFQMMLLIGLSVWGGIALDRSLAWRFPVFTVVFALISCLGSMFLLIKSLPALPADKQKK